MHGPGFVRFLLAVLALAPLARPAAAEAWNAKFREYVGRNSTWRSSDPIKTHAVSCCTDHTFLTGSLYLSFSSEGTATGATPPAPFTYAPPLQALVSANLSYSNDSYIDRGAVSTLTIRLHDSQSNAVVCERSQTLSTPKGSTTSFSLSAPCELSTLNSSSSMGFAGVGSGVYVNVSLGDGGAGAVWYDGASAIYEHSGGLDMSPAVSPNTVTTQQPLHAVITGGGFSVGSTVQVSIEDVKVISATVTSPTQISVALGGYQDLPDGPRDVEVTRSDGTKVKANDLFWVTSLEISPLEINQGVKIEGNCTAQLPCVADHRTVVRAKVVCNATSCPSGTATGRLHVFRAGTTTPIVGSPFSPSPDSFTLRTKAQPADPRTRHDAKDTLNFPFKGDRSLLAGSYDFVFEMLPKMPSVAPIGASVDERRSLLKAATGKVFKTSTAPIDVFVLPTLKGDGSEDFQSLVGTIDAFRRLRAAYPTSATSLNVVPLSGRLLPETGLQPVLPRLLALSLILREKTTSSNPAHLLHLTHEPFGEEAFSLCAFGAVGLLLANGCPYPAAIVKKGAVRGWTGAHLLGHDYGLGDVDTRQAQTLFGSDERLEPVSLASPINAPPCPVSRCACEDGHFDTVESEVSIPDEWGLAGLMGNYDRGSRKWWIDKRSWDFLYGRLMAPQAARSAPLAAPQDLILVTGEMTRAGAATFGPFTKLFAGLPATATGDCTVELQGASQQVLASVAFSLDLALLDQLTFLTALPFAVQVPWSAGTTRVVLKRSGSVLASRDVSSSAPSVTLAYPVGGETLSGTATIRWSGSDPDGNALTYSVYYSVDSTNWLPVALAVSGTSVVWDTSAAKGTTTGRIRVVASDGVNEGSATSPGTFTVASKGPAAVITAPADGAVVLAGTAVTFEGGAFDVEDGLLPSSALRFSSSRDGTLGKGESVTTAALSAGLHTITLTATDTTGAEATATISLTVFTPGPEPSATAFAPIVLSTAGLAGSHFTSELTLTNRGSSNATIELDYTSAFGGGTGVVYDGLGAGRQKIVPDAIEYLTGLGLSIPATGNRGGTLRVRFHGLSSPTAGSATIRTTTAVSNGRAGLSYPAIPPALLSGTVYLCGLRQTPSDRSNLALLNVGSETDGTVVLRPTVHSGDPAAPQSIVLPDVGLAPGGFTQLSQVLASSGLSLSNGYVKVERVSGTAPFFAYAVINDQANSDGSFVPPVLASSLVGRRGISLPVAVETSSFATELVVTNFGSVERTVTLAFVASAVQAAGNETSMTLTLAPGEQKVLPSFVRALRERGAPGIGPEGPTYAGAVFLTTAGGDVSGLFIGGRTSATGGGGRYGLFYTGVPYGAAATGSAWLYGLQQNEENRTNLAIVNTGEADASPSAFRVDLYDGDTGGLAGSVGGVSIPARGWVQLSSILKTHAPSTSHAYANVSRTAGTNPFLTYAVINDGGAPNQRSDDGAFVAMDLADQPAALPSLEVTPASLAFGSVAVGQTKDLTVSVRNVGTGTLTGTVTTAAPFTVTGGGSFSLAANAAQAVTVRFSPAVAGASSGSLAISSNGGSASTALAGTGTSAGVRDEELATDDGSIESGVLEGGLFVVNRLTPSGYPATLRKARLFITQYEGHPSPSGAQVRVMVFADPSGGGRPPAYPPVLLDQVMNLPAIPPGGAWVDFIYPSIPAQPSGDLYVGFQANAAGGVGFAADTNGTPKQRGFFSTDGGIIWKGPLALVNTQGQEVPANIMIRAVVSVPGP